MNVGFTGTRRGMTGAQLDAVMSILAELPVTEFHHGACHGADVQAHSLVKQQHPDAVLHAHPSTIAASRVLLSVDVEHAPDEPLTRNVHIVEAADHLIGTPDGPECRRSGTWATIRAARRRHKAITIVYPNGQTVTEPAEAAS